MHLETLYSRRGDGGVQEWTIEVEDNKYRTISGKIDGEKVVSEWTVCSGKNIGRSNETSPSQQAEAEAKAKWQKKRDRGYATSSSDIDSHGLFKPTLAHPYEDHKDKLFKKHRAVFSDPKLNGMRCVAKSDGLWTRNGKKIVSCPHIEKVLKPLFDKWPDMVLDGELYNHDLRHKLNRIMELVRKVKLSEEDLIRSETMIQYHIYDGVGVNGLGASVRFSERKSAIHNAIKTITPAGWTHPGHIRVVKSVLISSVDELDAEYKRLLADDWEGQMIRVDGPYHNKRTSNLLKRKEFQDEEFVIVDIEEGSGNWTGAAKSVICRHPDGRTFNSNIKGDFEYLQEVLNNKDSLIGRTATVQFFEKTEYGIPQFPFVVMIDRESVE